MKIKQIKWHENLVRCRVKPDIREVDLLSYGLCIEMGIEIKLNKEKKMKDYKFTALFCRADSAYKKRENWDVYDAKRNALEYGPRERSRSVSPTLSALGKVVSYGLRDPKITEEQKQAEEI